MSETITDTPTGEAPPRQLVRADEGRWLGGVCAGLGRYFDVNPLVYRIAFAALAFAGGTGVLLYIAAWLVMPAERDEDSIAVEAIRRHRERPWLLLGVALLALGALLTLSEARFWPGTGNVWLAATLIGAALVWWHVSSGGRVAAPASAPTPPGAEPAPPPPPTPRRPSLLPPVFGALLGAAGLAGLLAVLDVYSLDLAVAFAVAVAVVGAAVVAGALTGRRVGGLVLLGILLLGGFGIAASAPVSLDSGIGDKVERPVGSDALAREYELGIGDFTVDLADVELPGGRTHVDVKLGIGELVVTVPAGVAVEVDGRAGAGTVDVFGRTDDGVAAHVDTSIAAGDESRTLVIDADVAIGSLEVRSG